MNKEKDQISNDFQEQDAPLKNTDNAFVQVGTDGVPQIPNENEKAPSEENAKESHSDKMN
ncbi:MAG: hypothetical protein H0U44_00195 [Flavisolibacter sp.]|nr:hypothetical protein [Flavisolibacter sp.]